MSIGWLIDDMANEVAKADLIPDWGKRMSAHAAIARAYSFFLSEAKKEEEKKNEA